MIKKFWNNFDLAVKKAKEDINEVSAGTLVISFIVIAITGITVLLWTLYQLFGSIGVILSIPAFAVCRIIYAGIFAK